MTAPRDEGPGPDESAAAWAEGVKRDVHAPISYREERPTLKGCLVAVLVLAIIALAMAAIGASGGFDVIAVPEKLQ